MSVSTYLALCAVLYVLSVIVAYAMCLHTMRSWHSAYWRRASVSVLAAWHPVVASQWFVRGVPRRAPEDADWSAMYAFSAIPVFNTAFVLATGLAAGAEQLSRLFISSRATVLPGAFERRLFG